MIPLQEDSWSAMTWVLLFIAVLLMVLFVLLGLVAVLVRAAAPNKPAHHGPHWWAHHP